MPLLFIITSDRVSGKNIVICPIHYTYSLFLGNLGLADVGVVNVKNYLLCIAYVDGTNTLLYTSLEFMRYLFGW